MAQQNLHRSGCQSECLGRGFPAQRLMRMPGVVKGDPNNPGGVLQGFEAMPVYALFLHSMSGLPYCLNFQLVDPTDSITRTPSFVHSLNQSDRLWCEFAKVGPLDMARVAGSLARQTLLFSIRGACIYAIRRFGRNTTLTE
ncbi:hypothetical protein [Noviherbaspirillum cavernae]|uniref:hypothetical protein n=1 Tax=Noviherbaspirillum cavernae TaxID=2320862 RepID=UPI003BF58910